jgi:hypothetical protein
MTLATLADVRELMRHLPKEHRSKSTWRHVAAELDKAAAGAGDVADVDVVLRLVFTCLVATAAMGAAYFARYHYTPPHPHPRYR